jgi:hypothetical protein
MANEKPFTEQKTAEERGVQPTIINSQQENPKFVFVIAGEGYFVETEDFP